MKRNHQYKVVDLYDSKRYPLSKSKSIQALKFKHRNSFSSKPKQTMPQQCLTDRSKQTDFVNNHLEQQQKLLQLPSVPSIQSIASTHGSVKMKAFIRFRPFSSIQIKNTQQIKLIKNIDVVNDQYLKVDNNIVNFTKIFTPQDTQQQVYNLCAKQVIQKFLDGFNGTIFAYGQTGSGKTYTMFGNERKGIIPLSVKDIFKAINTTSQQSTQSQAKLQISILQIYKQNLIDLLNANASKAEQLKIKQINGKIVVNNLTLHETKTAQEVYQLLTKANDIKKMRQTSLNEMSSRSHIILTLYLQKKTHDNQIKRAKLNLIDLAGSQKVSKSRVEGEGLQQAKKINYSLACLGNTINALVKNQQHIPYRQSKLTRYLQQSLSGNSLASIIITCSIHESCTQQTISSIKFAQRAKRIKTFPLQNLQKLPENTINRFIFESLKINYDKIIKKLNNIKQTINELQQQKNLEEHFNAEYYLSNLIKQLRMVINDINDIEVEKMQENSKIIKMKTHADIIANDGQIKNQHYSNRKHIQENEIKYKLEAKNDEITKLNQQILKLKQKIIQHQKEPELNNNSSKNKSKLTIKHTIINPNKIQTQQSLKKIITKLNINIEQITEYFQKDKNNYYKFQRKILQCQIQDLMNKLCQTQSSNIIQFEKYNNNIKNRDKYIEMLEKGIFQVFQFLKNKLFMIKLDQDKVKHLHTQKQNKQNHIQYNFRQLSLMNSPQSTKILNSAKSQHKYQQPIDQKKYYTKPFQIFTPISGNIPDQSNRSLNKQNRQQQSDSAREYCSILQKQLQLHKQKHAFYNYFQNIEYKKFRN